MTLSWLPDLVTRDIDRMLHYTLLWGFEAVDLRMVENARVPHVKEEKLIRRLRDAEVDVATVVPGLFEGPIQEKVGWMNDIAALPDTVRFCRHVGCRTILVSSFQATDAPDARDMVIGALRRAGDVAGKFSLRIAVSNESGGFVASTEDLAALVMAVDHDSVVASWSPAEAQLSGDLMSRLDDLIPRLVHIRATQIRQKNGEHLPAPFEDGTIAWGVLLSRLRSAGFDEVISVEPRAEPIKKQTMRDATILHKWWREARQTG